MSESNECPPDYSKLIEEKGQCIYQKETVTTYEKKYSSTFYSIPISSSTNSKETDTQEVKKNEFLTDENSNSLSK